MVEQCIYVVMYIKSWPAAEIRLHLYESSRLIPVDSSSAYSNEARCFNRCFTTISRAVHLCRAVHKILACGRNSPPPICLPLIEMKRVSHHACTNPLMHVRNDMEQQTNINMFITLMNNGATESEDEIHPLTVTCT
jgi:hypothetical protein